jgi:hypothetical protein
LPTVSVGVELHLLGTPFAHRPRHEIAIVAVKRPELLMPDQ